MILVYFIQHSPGHSLVSDHVWVRPTHFQVTLVVLSRRILSYYRNVLRSVTACQYLTHLAHEIDSVLKWLGYAAYSTQAFSDILIMISICSTLMRRRSKVQRWFKNGRRWIVFNSYTGQIQLSIHWFYTASTLAFWHRKYCAYLLHSTVHFNTS
jgi:hypothetical protein